MKTTNVDIIATMMGLQNIPVLSSAPATELTDGCITVTENIHLSIHRDGTFIVGNNTNGYFEFIPCPTMQKSFDQIKLLTK